MAEQAQVLQILHDVADRGGREVDAGQPGDGAGTHRQPGIQIALDDEPEHVAGAVGHFGYGRGGHGIYVISLRPPVTPVKAGALARSEEHTSELQSLMRISYAVFCLKKKKSTGMKTTYKHELQL